VKVTSLEAGRDSNWRRAGGCDVRADWDVWICDGDGEGESQDTLTEKGKDYDLAGKRDEGAYLRRVYHH
jgi:hypothetical protein